MGTATSNNLTLHCLPDFLYYAAMYLATTITCNHPCQYDFRKHLCSSIR